jgi:hypothetical protein
LFSSRRNRGTAVIHPGFSAACPALCAVRRNPVVLAKPFSYSDATPSDCMKQQH